MFDFDLARHCCTLIREVELRRVVLVGCKSSTTSGLTPMRNKSQPVISESRLEKENMPGLV